jgi:xylose dehydrogenase (NAD/NADP)
MQNIIIFMILISSYNCNIMVFRSEVMQHTQLKWGVLGCANIAIHRVIPGIQASATGDVVAIASREAEKAQKTAEKCGIPKAYSSYEQLLKDPAIDAVYIPLPNHLHKEWTIKAAQAGKHVLCEKPIALNHQEVKQMVEASEQAGVLLAEAFMYRHHPRYAQIQTVLQSGEIGEIRGIHSNFTFHGEIEKSNVRYVQAMGGGSLYDIGVYPISAARMILVTEPEAATVHAYFSKQHDNVDMMASGMIEFPNQIALTFDCGMWAYYRNELEILGTKGRIIVPSAFVDPQNENSFFHVTTQEGTRVVETPIVNQYALQADAFAYAIWGEKPLRFGAQDAIKNMLVLDACLQSARERRRIEISH